jgi:hypothetical protein
MDETQGPLEREIEELFTRNLAGHPSILALTTGEVEVTDPKILLKSIEALSLLAITEREALVRIAREVDNLRSD